ncbi:MAG: hypothetical protein A2Y12_18510 [Planctomycetes bacterium GWF2_42_9]|nr:MAG: hypothetical protein A2Y12_18510 [Planctomycetes bacterium GWF2_42_9]
MDKLQLAAASAKSAKNIKSTLFSLIETPATPKISSKTAKNTKFASVFTETISKTQPKIADKIQPKQPKTITETPELSVSLIAASQTTQTPFLAPKTTSKTTQTTPEAPQTAKIEAKNSIAVQNQNQPEKPAKEAKTADPADSTDPTATEKPEKTEKLPNETAAERNKGQQGLAQRSETASEHANNVKTTTSGEASTQAQPVIELKQPKLQTPNKPESAENTQPKIDQPASDNSVQAPKITTAKPQTPPQLPHPAIDPAPAADKRHTYATEPSTNPLNLNFDPAAPAKAPGMNPAATIVYVDSPALDNQISAPIASALNRVGQSVNITLNPPELGRMNIKFEQQGTELIGRIEFENASVGDQLESSLPRVIQNLQDSGVAVREIQLIYKGGEQSYDGLPDNNQANNRGQGQSQDKQHFTPGSGPNTGKAADSYNLEQENSAYITETAVNMWI